LHGILDILKKQSLKLYLRQAGFPKSTKMSLFS
jgi:hypothetical protein